MTGPNSAPLCSWTTTTGGSGWRSCGAIATPGRAVLYGMWVAPQARGRRGALALIDVCASWAKARGLHELTLTVVVGNEPALRAYRAAGFVARGETTWSQAGRTLDELIMSRPV
jgi:RimJ/RimL family protein N-acetyltransferase